MTEAVLKEAQDLWHRAYDMGASCADGQFVDPAAILVIAEALRARDERIAELENLAKANNDLARIEVAYRKQLAFQRAEMANALEAVTSQYGDRLPAQFLADLTAMLMRPALRSVALKEKNDVA